MDLTGRKGETMTIHSKDGASGQTKLERISELSAKDRGIVFNNVGHIIDWPMLMKTYALLDGNKAVGIDGVTKAEYGRNLEENLKQLLIRIRRGTYRPKPARVVEIPKEDGSTRPLAIANIYLHEVIDEWFEKIKRKNFRGAAEMVRYCDDMVFIFQKPEECGTLI